MKRERTRSPSQERSRYRERSRSMGKRRCDGNTEGEYVEEADEKFWVKNERIESSRMERGRVSIGKERELRFNEEKKEITGRDRGDRNKITERETGERDKVAERMKECRERERSSPKVRPSEKSELTELHFRVVASVKKNLNKYYRGSHAKIESKEEFSTLAKSFSDLMMGKIKDSYQAYNNTLEGISFTTDMKAQIAVVIESHFDC